MKGDPTPALRIEPRWPVALAILVVSFVLVLPTECIWLFPHWTPYVVTIAMLAPMAAVPLTAAKARWLRIERTITVLFFLVVAGATFSNLVFLTRAMVHRPEAIDGIQLLSSSIGVWMTNVLAFSIIYWRIDRGGPEARANSASTRPDWLFPQAGLPPTCRQTGSQPSSTTCTSDSRRRRRSAPPTFCR